jgi:hypothetical protein
MTSNAEFGLQEWLQNALTDPPAIHTGLTAEVIPPESQVISCYVERSERAAGPLYRLFSRLIVSTPSHEGDDAAAALASHKAIVGEIRALLENPDATDIETDFNTGSGLTWKGGYFRGESEGIDSGRWITTLDFIAGISTAA